MSLGSTAANFLAAHDRADVVGVFRDGCYLGSGHDLMALVGPSISPGPLNLRLRRRFVIPAAGAECRIHRSDDGSGAGGLTVGGLRVELGGVERFRPRVPAAARNARALMDMDVPVPADLATVWNAATAGIRAGALAEVGGHLSGRGRGLTPEGDDVLAGILLALSGEKPLRPLLADVAEKARTTDLSRAFLAAAARGECVSELHDLLWAAAKDDGAAFLVAHRRVWGIGGSTGPAMLAGLRLACFFPAGESVGVNRSRCASARRNRLA